MILSKGIRRMENILWHFYPLQATQKKLSKLHYIGERMLGGSCSTQAFCGQPFGRTLCDTDRSAGNEIPDFDAEL